MEKRTRIIPNTDTFHAVLAEGIELLKKLQLRFIEGHFLRRKSRFNNFELREKLGEYTGINDAILMDEKLHKYE